MYTSHSTFWAKEKSFTLEKVVDDATNIGESTAPMVRTSTWGFGSCIDEKKAKKKAGPVNQFLQNFV